jgi:hypothetical protein
MQWIYPVITHSIQGLITAHYLGNVNNDIAHLALTSRLTLPDNCPLALRSHNDIVRAENVPVGT